jgi:glycosyltransferase involved in cell wall biosynthesis
MRELKTVNIEANSDLLPYPIDMSALLTVPLDSMDEKGVLRNSPQDTLPAVYNPTSIAQYGLVHWNAYLTHGGDEHREIFLALANWLLAHKSPLSNGACGWPISYSSNAQGISRPCLSALTQGIATSALLRAYQLTGRDTFMQAARQTVLAFELDILDGGVSSPIGDAGVFFEEFAIYPAAHVLSAHILALFGLYDYVAFTHDNKIKVLIQRGIDALHTMLDAYDIGYWTRYDFLYKHLASQFYHSFHITLLEVLAGYSGCEHCSAIATRWASYRHHPGCRLRYLITNSTSAWCDSKLKPRLRRLIFHSNAACRWTLPVRVCIPISGFPVAGGMRSVLAGVAQVMGDRWKMAYLTHHKGQRAEGLEIETFGRRVASPWYFPFVWLYWLAGGRKLFALLRRGPGYDLILPQDGVHSGAFAALVGKIAGVRVVCMDHGNVALLDNPTFRSEVIGRIQGYPWYRRTAARLQLPFYRVSMRLLARIAARCAEQFLVAGDEVEAVYRENLGVHPARIIRYVYMLDADRFIPPEKKARAKIRAEHGIPENAIMITLINRFVPEKGLDLAIEGIAQALSTLSPDVRMRVKVLIAGDGPLRSQIEERIWRHGLDSTCRLWGEAAPSDVVMLLAISDIFLYSGTRGTNYSMAVLEAMAAGCAVIATTHPLSNAKLLAEGRGIALAAEEIEPICEALVRLVNDPELCLQMGHLARNYVAAQHNATMLKRALMRTTFWSELDEFFEREGKSKN